MTDSSDVSADEVPMDDGFHFEEIADLTHQRLGKNQRVRRNLPGDGRLRIDRQLPFLCIYRSPPDHPDAGTRELVTTEAAYLFASGEPRYHDGISRLCQRIGSSMQEHFGTFLFVEIWSHPLDEAAPGESGPTVPKFQVVTPDPGSIPSTLHVFVQALSNISLNEQSASVRVRRCEQIAPPGLLPLSHLTPELGTGGYCVLGVAVDPLYRDRRTGRLFPVVLQHLRWQLAGALRRAVAEFTGVDSGGDSVHFETFGPSSLVKAARIVDQELCEVAESFDFVLQATPTNSEQAWEEFAAGGYRTAPTLHYRPLMHHPNLLKRALFDIEIERIEDPTIAHLFWEKQDEVDRQLSALRDIDTPEFLYSSLQLYGEADDDLVELARRILKHPSLDRNSSFEDGLVAVKEFVDRAREEIDYYHQRLPSFKATVEVCDHIAAGIMVSQDRLLISRKLRLRRERVVPLLHHEVGTHLLTYFNGCCQPFRQLYSGLAGYDELQEGLAVLAEYLSGGLSTARLKVLAARVMAVRSLANGDAFPQTFAIVVEECGLEPRQAFTTTLRVHRGGGLTKDVIYLRGLRNLLRYLSNRHEIEPFYVGKVALHHLPYVQEMRRRGIIRAPQILPRLWESQCFRERLDRCRGMSPLELMEADP